MSQRLCVDPRTHKSWAQWHTSRALGHGDRDRADPRDLLASQASWEVEVPGSVWDLVLEKKKKKKKKVKGNREGYLALTSDPHTSMDVKYICIHEHIYVFLLDTCIHKYKLYVVFNWLAKNVLLYPLYLVGSCIHRDKPSASSGSGRTGKKS